MTTPTPMGPAAAMPPSGIDLLRAGRLTEWLADDRRLERLIPERSAKGHLLWIHNDGSRTP